MNYKVPNMSIWRFRDLDFIKENYRLTLNEGDTPLEKINILGDPVSIKREDKNPNGSFKDRSLAYQISYYYEHGINHFVISSSGNAAISAAAYIKLIDATLDIFLSEKTDVAKKEKLNSVIKNTQKVTLHFTPKAKSDAMKFALEKNYLNLRGSVDDKAVIGFETIAFELFEQDPAIDAVFIPCSSGTSTTGIYKGYFELLKQRKISKIPQIHIIQNTKIHPIASEYDKNFTSTKTVSTNCIVDRVAKRKRNVMNYIERSSGSGWVVSDEEVDNARRLMGDQLSDISNNSLLSLAGLLKASQKGYRFRNPCLIFSGL